MIDEGGGQPKERRRFTDENLNWFVSNVLPLLKRDITEPVMEKLNAQDASQSVRNAAQDERIEEIASAVKSHTLQCFLVAALTGFGVSAVLWLYWH